MRPFTSFELKNLKYFVQRELEVTLVQITETGLKKSILDATGPIRDYFLRHKVHNYTEQEQGPEHKVEYPTVILTTKQAINTTTSLYRPVTKKGDPRFWISGYKGFVNADDIHAIFNYNDCLYVIDITQIDIEKCCEVNIQNPIKRILENATLSISKVSDELLMKLRKYEGQWIPCEITADTGVGRTIESLLGIEMNDSKEPDYHGIEIKSGRIKQGAQNRNTLFSKVPDWNLSKLKSGRAVADKYGEHKDGPQNPKTLRHTLSCLKPNSYHLRLNMNYSDKFLEIEEDEIVQENIFKKINDVALWTLNSLHETLLQKHKETFWIEVNRKKEDGQEYFKIKRIKHTKNPIVSQFDVLVEQSKITVDLLLGRPKIDYVSGKKKKGGDCVNFKIQKAAIDLLFPESIIYEFKQ